MAHAIITYSDGTNESVALEERKTLDGFSVSLSREKIQKPAEYVDFMPEYFTLTSLQNVYELILDKKLFTANFRRKIADYVVETEQMVEGEGFRPAKLFQRNVEKFFG